MRASDLRSRLRVVAIGALVIVLAARAGAQFASTTPSMNAARWVATATLLPNGKVLIAGGNNSSDVLSSTELYDPATGAFAAVTPSMNTARNGATATLLPNGKVLIAGGGNDTGNLSSTELYDPATNTFAATTPSMNAVRAGATATLLPNGKVLIAGGETIHSYGGRLSSTELYDPATNAFAATTPSMNAARTDATATLLPGGKVLIAGGIGATGILCLSSTEIYDPVTNTFAASTPTMNVGRAVATATPLPSGEVLIAGGIEFATAYISSTELYDPVTNTFAVTTPSMNVARYNATSTLLPNGNVLITGGFNSGGPLASTEIYAPATNTFAASTPSMNSARTVATATLLSNGEVLIAGGSSLSAILSSTEIYDPSQPSFAATTPSMNVARQDATATLLPSGKLLVAGGFNGAFNYLSSTDIYDPVTNAFTATTASMNTARGQATATLLPSGKVLIAGGANSGYLSSTEIFDPPTNTFASTTPSMNVAREWATATLLPNGNVLIAGGVNVGHALSSVELFDPTTDTFAATTPLMNAARFQATAVLLTSGKVLIAGGFSNSGYLSSTELYDPATNSFASTSPSMNAARRNATATLLPNGRVLIAGGEDSVSVLSNTDLYDSVTNAFEATTPSMNLAHASATSTLLQDGKVLIAGGANGVIANLPGVEIYDPATNTFASTSPSMNEARVAATAALLPNGKVLIAGGAGNGSGPGILSSTEIFDAGFGFSDANRPVISTVTSPILEPGELTLTGSGFQASTQGPSGAIIGTEASGGGTTSNSATNYPLVQLHRIDNDLLFFSLTAESGSNDWTDTSCVSTELSGLPAGHYRATVFVNAIPSDAGIVVIEPASSAASGPVSGSTCSGTPTQLTLTVNSVTAAVPDSISINWGDGSPVDVETVSSVPAVFNHTITPVNSGGSDTVTNYTVSVSDASGSVTVLGNPLSVTVHPLPTPSITPNGPTTFCAGGSVQLDAGAGYSSYKWSPGNQTTRTITVSSAGSYSVTVTDGNSCQGTSSAVGVTVNPLPTPSITPNGPTTFCVGGSVQLDGGAGYSSYKWSPGNQTTRTITVSATASYSVTVTDGNSCQGTSSAVGVTVNPLPTPTITPNGPTTFCVGGSVQLDAGAGYASYKWSPGNQTTRMITVSATGSYSVTVTDGNGCQGTSSSVGVTVNPVPTPSITPNGPTTFCTGGSVQLDAGAGYSSYKWSPGNQTTRKITVSSTGSYSVTVMNANSCPGASSAVGVTVSPLPTPSITPSGPTTFCGGGSVQLDSGAGYLSYKWSPGNQTTRMITVSASGSYSVTVTDANSCQGTSSAVGVTVNSAPSASVGPGGSICAGQTSRLLSGSGGVSCSWSPSTGLDNPNSCSPAATPSVATTYTLTVIDANGCQSSNNPTVLVTVITPPAAPIVSAQPGCIAGASASSASASGNPSDTFTWTISSGSILSGQGTNAVTFAGPPAGSSATLSVTESNALSCAIVPGSVVVWSAFADISASILQSYICDIQRAGLTSGCGNGDFCPTATVTRDTMAIFLLRGEHGGGYVPPPCESPIFGDVPCSNPYAAWINQLKAEGITSGCGNGNYCPLTKVTRDTMAIFLLRAEHGGGYAPPPCLSAKFTDVPCSNQYSAWINELSAEGITSGCGAGIYCPTSPVTREQMAKFLDLALLQHP